MFIFVTKIPMKVAKSGDDKLTTELYMPLILARNETSISFKRIILILLETIDKPITPIIVPKKNYNYIYNV